MQLRVHGLVSSLAAVLLSPVFCVMLPARLTAASPAGQPAATQPILTAYPASFDVIPLASGKVIVVFGQVVGIPLPKGLNPASLSVSTESESGFSPADGSIFYGVQIYSVSGSVDKLTDQQLAPPAIDEVHKRWASVLAADAPVAIEQAPGVLLKLGYSAHLCHGVMHMVDRYAKFGKDLMRITVVPMSQTLTAEQFADLSAKADVAVDQLIASAKPFDAQAVKRQSLAAQRAKPVAPTPTGASNSFARSAPAGFSGSASSKASSLDLMNHRAELALAQADKLKAAGKDVAAYERYKFIAKQYAKTPSADPAGKAVTAYESDADFMTKYNGATTQPTQSPIAHAASDAAKADALLSLADSYAAADKPDLAREKYQSVIDRFPATPAAAKAKQKLAAM